MADPTLNGVSKNQRKIEIQKFKNLIILKALIHNKFKINWSKSQVKVMNEIRRNWSDIL